MKILYYFPHRFYPSETGAHVRALQTICSLTRCGCDVYVAAMNDGYYSWDRSGADYVGGKMCSGLFLFSGEPGGRLKRGWGAAKRLSGSILRGSLEVGDGYFPNYFGAINVGAREWFSEVIESVQPDVVWFAYPQDVAIMRIDQSAKWVMELYDMTSENVKVQNDLKVAMVPDEGGSKLKTKGDFLNLNFQEALDHKPDDAELEIVRSFGNGIALSKRDLSLLEACGVQNRAYIPVMVGVPGEASDCLGPPCMAFGPNFLNLQGFLHLRDRVLPHVRSSLPELEIHCFGKLPNGELIPSTEGIVMRGFVKEFRDAMMGSGFFINPVFSGTGMQIKTIEAMAWGLAPVAYESVAESAGIVHMESGWVAKNEEEFAEGIRVMAEDVEFRQKCGARARSHVIETCSESALDRSIQDFISKLESNPSSS